VVDAGILLAIRNPDRLLSQGPKWTTRPAGSKHQSDGVVFPQAAKTLLEGANRKNTFIAIVPKKCKYNLYTK